MTAQTKLKEIALAMARTTDIGDHPNLETFSLDYTGNDLWGVDFMAMATAAIQAMMEPTGAMLNAACKSMSPDKRPTEAWVSVKQKHSIRYQAMLQSILDEGQKP